MTGPRPIAAIVYLDIDDEITSAASRIRTTQERRLALVLPAGSRVSTSRINFRLLAREATTRGRDLAIVTPEASTRALAAAAGLPVFASVADYETSLDDEPDTPDDEGPDGDAEPTSDGEAAAPVLAGDRDAATPDAGATTTGAEADTTVGQLTGWWARDAEAAEPSPARLSPRSGASARGVGAAGSAASAGNSVRSGPMAGGAGRTGSAARGGPASVGSPATSTIRSRSSMTDTVLLPAAGEFDDAPPRRRFSGLVLALISTLIVVLVIGSVAGWLLLPAATVTVAARVDAVGPLQFTVRADPLEVSVDPANGIVPADVVTFDLSVSQDFPATGKKVTETKASGSVRWTNCDPTRAYTIPDGTIVKDGDGLQFATTDSVFLPVAILSGNPPTISCQSRDVGVTARAAGTDGNVAAGTITDVPSDYNSVVIRVTNPAATTGGTHTEAKVVAQKDVDAAMTALAKALRDEFTAQLADPSKAPAGQTLFPGTKSMSSGEPTVDPGSLVGQVTPTFTLGLTGSGTATAVDPATVQALGDQRIRAAVSADRSLVKDSVDVRVGAPRVDGSAVLFPVTARASEVNTPDAAAIRTMVKGLPVDEARERLRNYGDATVDVWPGWVTSITTYDFRLDVHVVSDVATEPTVPTPTASPSVGPSSAPVTLPPLESTAPSGGPASSGSAPSGASGSAGPSAAPASGSPKASAKPRPSGAPSAGPSAT